MLTQKAVPEHHVAAEVITGELQGSTELAAAAFNARVIPSVAYSSPEVAWVVLIHEQAKVQGIKFKKGLCPWQDDSHTKIHCRADPADRAQPAN